MEYLPENKPQTIQSPVSEKKLSANEAIIMLVNAINSDNKAEFYNILERYLKGLAVTGEYSQRLKIALFRKPRVIQLSELPMDLKKLIIQSGQEEGSPVYTNQKTRKFLDQLILEWKHSEDFRYHNLRVRNKLLLHGPTGNGKTTLARYIATRLGLPFIEVNADYMIDSHVGKSGANIYNLFNNLQQPCVLFWDEVDTIGRARGKDNDSAAGMENERMVNSVLVNLDKLKDKVLFIGATNRMEVLDAAFLRRFDTRFEVGKPEEEEKQSFARQLIAYYKLPLGDYNTSPFNSLAEINLDLADRARQYILSKIQSAV